MVKVNVLYFGVLKELAGAASRTLELTERASVADVLAGAAGSEPVWRSIAVGVNGVYATRETELRGGDEVSLLPPVSGGRHAR